MTDKDLLKRIDKLEQMLKSCKEALDSYQKAVNIFIDDYNSKKEKQ